IRKALLAPWPRKCGDWRQKLKIPLGQKGPKSYLHANSLFIFPIIGALEMDAGTAPEMPRVPPRGPVFYGWYVVAAVFIIHTVSCGLIFYNLSIFLKAFVAEGGFSVSAASNATAIFFVSSGITGLAVGWLLDRYDPRWVVTAGALISASVLASAGHVTSLWQLYGFYVLFGVGNAAVAVIPG